MAVHSNGTTPTGTGRIVTGRRGELSKSGVTKLVETWDVNTDTFTSALPAYLTPHATYTGLYSTDVSFQQGDNNITQVTVTYEGYTGSVEISTVPPVYEWNGSFEQIPIELNPDFNTAISTVEAAGKNPKDDQGRFVGFPAGSTVSGRSVAGVTSFLSASGTWTKRWIQTTRPVATSGVGYIGTPPGTPPTFTDSREWLVGPLSYREAGGVFECSQTWLLSQPGGFSYFYVP